MKVVAVLGSPRKNANSTVMAERFCNTAKTLGATVQTFTLNDLNFKGCQGCMACKTTHDRCILKDDLTEVLDAIREADILIAASPVSYWDVSGQFKCFQDRTFSYLVPDFQTAPVASRLEPGKKLVFILAQANPDANLFTDIFPRYEYFYKIYGFSETRLIRACGVGAPGAAADLPEVMTLAEKTAVDWCGK